MLNSAYLLHFIVLLELDLRGSNVTKNSYYSVWGLAELVMRSRMQGTWVQLARKGLSSACSSCVARFAALATMPLPLITVSLPLHYRTSLHNRWSLGLWMNVFSGGFFPCCSSGFGTSGRGHTRSFESSRQNSRI